MRLQWSYDQWTRRNTEMPWLGKRTPAELAAAAAEVGLSSVEMKRSVISESFPYVVPEGYYLGIEKVQFACKVSFPASYCIITNAFSISSTYPFIDFPAEHPFLMPSGAEINALFINNSFDWDQWMNMVMVGRLIPNYYGL